MASSNEELTRSISFSTSVGLNSAMRHPLLGFTEAKDTSEHDAGRNGDAANHFHRRRGAPGDGAHT